MIVLSKNVAKITINRYEPIDCVRLTLVNNLTGKEYSFEQLTNTSNSSFFYEFTIDMSNLIDGEYTVYLYDSDDEKIGEPMLAVCGEYTKTRTSYQKQNNKIVYERN